MLNQSAARELVHDQLFPLYSEQRKQLDVIDSWYRWDHEPLKLPRHASEEHRALANMSRTPWLNLVVTTVAQALVAVGYKATDPSLWDTWQANDFDTRQFAIHRAALAYGLAYNVVTPGTDMNGPRSVMRGVSPRKMVAVYADAAEDDWPLFAARFEKASKTNYMVRLYDEEAVYFVDLAASGDQVEFIEAREHSAGVCPIIRYANQLDLDGRADGEVVPLIPAARRLNKTDYDRMLAQHSNSWNLRVFTGIDVAKGPNGTTDGAGAMSDAERRIEAEQAQMRLRQSDIVTLADPNSKAFSLPATPLEGFKGSTETDLESLASISQVPITAFSRLSNISEGTLVEVRAGLNQKVAERQMNFGKSHAQSLRLAAQLEGKPEAAADFRGRMDWKDTRVRNWGATVDALGKAATMLGVDPTELWEELPWLDQTDLEDMRSRAGQADARTTRERIATAAAQAAQDPTVARLVSRANPS